MTVDTSEHVTDFRITRIAGLVMPPVLLVVGLIVVWAVLSAIGIIPSYFLPPPGAVLAEVLSSPQVLFRHAGATALEALAGFAIGNVTAVVVACILSLSGILRDAFYPYALFSRAVPIIVFTPLIVVMMGRGQPPIITIVAFTCYFPTFLNVMRGLASPPAEHRELMWTLSSSRLQRLWLIEFPAAVPFLFAALKVSASLCVLSALVTEWIGTNVGLGYLVVVSGQYFQLPLLWAAIGASATLTLSILGAVHLAEACFRPYSAHTDV